MNHPLHTVQLLPALGEGGVERGVVEMNRELVRRGVRSTVVSAGGRLAPHIERDGGTHITLDVKSKNILTAFSRARNLRRALLNLAPDVVHVRSRVPGWLARMARLPFPVVTTVHGFNSVNPYSAVMARGARVICASTFMMEWVKKNYHTPENILRLIPRGIDPELFDPQKINPGAVASLRTCHGLDGFFVVLGLGRVTSWKGYDTLIRALALAADPRMKAVIAGGVQAGQERHAEELKTLARGLGVADRVVFVGSQPNVAEWYLASDVLASCAFQKPETFGRSMTEALAMGRPVVAARHGGALDIVRDNENGFFFTPGDAQGLAEKLRLAKARQHDWRGLRAGALERFSLARMVDKTLAVYREVAPL
jgi:glycosyltransferase involved in cell wall biosynthesis